jgi:hypothetical protein
MVDKLENIPEEFQSPNPLETVTVENFEGIGEITIGVGNNWHILTAGLCLLNHPQVNKYLLAQKLKLSDRLTKTKIFPREGMALPDGEVYHEVFTEDKKER